MIIRMMLIRPTPCFTLFTDCAACACVYMCLPCDVGEGTRPGGTPGVPMMVDSRVLSSKFSLRGYPSEGSANGMGILGQGYPEKQKVQCSGKSGCENQTCLVGRPRRACFICVVRSFMMNSESEDGRSLRFEWGLVGWALFMFECWIVKQVKRVIAPRC
ncbi:hypothetical protein BXZ70DRAFT_962590 [Cristinia sonorae]|uniref:Secreted protein n=1 Tax=Cristinia sonorae TaxID=1940300 RepID=A0A8K0UD90_9AGAR|nr:hypothetical protein BXZ70DRAFT_962590 [Cristinia sonorae]